MIKTDHRPSEQIQGKKPDAGTPTPSKNAIASIIIIIFIEGAQLAKAVFSRALIH